MRKKKKKEQEEERVGEGGRWGAEEKEKKTDGQAG